MRILEVLGCLITQQHTHSSIQLSCWTAAHQVKGFPLVLNFCHPCQCAEELWHTSVLMSLLCKDLNNRLKYLLRSESRPFLEHVWLNFIEKYFDSHSLWSWLDCSFKNKSYLNIFVKICTCFNVFHHMHWQITSNESFHLKHRTLWLLDAP